MKDSTFFESIADNAYSFYSTILLYGFNENERDLLEESLKGITTFDSIKKRKCEIQILDTERITDIYAIPYFLAFINFKCMPNEDIDGVIEFFSEIESSGELGEDSFGPNPIVYAVNCVRNIDENITPKFKFNDNIFSDKEKLRLIILSEVKDLEGKGVASVNSNRIYRVLTLYKYLRDEGSISKKVADKILYPDEVSLRMFYKDMSVIKFIEEGNLIFDRKMKVYRLQKNK